MATPLHGRIRILLLATMTAGLAALAPDLTAQAGPGEPGRSLATWVSEARESPFHVPAGPGAPENPTVAPADDIGTANTHEVRWNPPPAPDSAVSPGRVFAFALAGATIPLIPAMYYGGLLAWGDEGPNYGLGITMLASMVSGAVTTLVTVPVAANLAGAESLGRVLGGTAYGFGVGLAFAALATALPDREFWMVPVFSVTMAAVTAHIATVRGNEAGRPLRGLHGSEGRTSRWSVASGTSTGPVS